MYRWLLAIVVVGLAAGCGGASENVSPTGVGSAAVRASSLSAADFAAQAGRICGDGQQQVYQAIETAPAISGGGRSRPSS
jgi:hypothetical protein